MKIQSFINGMLVGILIGVLFARDSGEETRRKLTIKTSTIKDSMKDTYNEFADNVSNQERILQPKV